MIRDPSQASAIGLESAAEALYVLLEAQHAKDGGPMPVLASKVMGELYAAPAGGGSGGNGYRQEVKQAGGSQRWLSSLPWLTVHEPSTATTAVSIAPHAFRGASRQTSQQVRGRWSVVGGWWSVVGGVSGQWSVVSGQWQRTSDW